MTQKQKSLNLFDDLIRRRDETRKRLREGRQVVREQDEPLENNPMGLYRWYSHPTMADITNHNLLFWVQHIPPGSRSGKQKHQGGRVHYVWEGRGYTVLDGVKYDWEQGDLILIPIKPDGVVFQHFADPRMGAKLLCAETNWTDVLGVDLAARFEVLEPSPDYKPPKA